MAPRIANKNKWVGLDLGGTKMYGMVFDDSLTCKARDKRKTKPSEGLKSVMTRIEETIQTALDLAGIDRSELSGIGMAVPGMLDLDNGIILEAPNLGWKRVKIKMEFERIFGCPVVISNDVDAGVYGEYTKGSAQKSRCVVGIFPGTGIGGGCVYEGKLMRGAVNSCMEIGHIPVVKDGALCGCGRRGCLETVASRLAIAQAAAVAVYRGEAPHLAALAGTDIAQIRSGALRQAIDEGDVVIKEIVRDAARWTGKAVATMVDLLAPDTIVIGGGLMEAFGDQYLKDIQESALEAVLPSYRSVYRIVAAKLGDDAAALGAASWAQNVVRSTGK